MNKLRIHNLRHAERGGRLVLGLGIILAVMSGNGPLGWAAVLPLVALYPAMTAVIGWDPINAWFERGSVAQVSASAKGVTYAQPAYAPPAGASGYAHGRTAE